MRSVGKLALAAALVLVTGCRAPLPPSKPLSELTPVELRGHAIFVNDCARCHDANDERSLNGPGLQGLFKQKYLRSGAPTNDDRVSYVILHGRGMMPGFGDTLDEEQLQALLAYLHTL